MTEILNLPIQDNIINFKLFTDINLYGIYNPEFTTLGKVIDAFHENYECKNINKKNIQIYSEELDRYFVEDDMSQSMKNLQLSQFSKFKLKLKFDEPDKLSNIEIEKYLDKVTEEIKQDKNKIQILCKSITGKITTLNIIPTLTIKTVKYLYKREAKESSPPDQIRFIFGGQQLEDDLTGETYNICNDHTIHVCLRLSGGMFHETSGRNGNYQPLRESMFLIQTDMD